MNKSTKEFEEVLQDPEYENSGVNVTESAQALRLKLSAMSVKEREAWRSEALVPNTVPYSGEGFSYNYFLHNIFINIFSHSSFLIASLILHSPRWIHLALPSLFVYSAHIYPSSLPPTYQTSCIHPHSPPFLISSYIFHSHLLYLSQSLFPLLFCNLFILHSLRVTPIDAGQHIAINEISDFNYPRQSFEDFSQVIYLPIFLFSATFHPSVVFAYSIFSFLSFILPSSPRLASSSSSFLLP